MFVHPCYIIVSNGQPSYAVR